MSTLTDLETELKALLKGFKVLVSVGVDEYAPPYKVVASKGGKAIEVTSSEPNADVIAKEVLGKF